MDEKFNSARQIRQKLLEHAPEIIQSYIDYSLGRLYDFGGDPKALETIFKSITTVIKMEDDTLTLSDKDIVEKANKKENISREQIINAITREMIQGFISPIQANQAVEAVKNGMDMVEVENMLNDIKRGFTNKFEEID